VEQIMMYTRRELKRIVWILSVLTVVSVIVAAGFAVLYLTREEPSQPTDMPIDTKPEDTEMQTADTEELASLRRENDGLRQQLETLWEELEQMREEATGRLPESDADMSELYDPGNLSPADPKSLIYTFDLTAQLERISLLEESMKHTPFIVDPEGELILFEELVLDEETEIIYCAAPDSSLDEDGRPTETVIDYEAMGYTYPKIAISYRDLVRGTTYAFGGDEVFNSASLIKVPYIYTLLYRFAQYNEIKAANPENDPDIGETLPEKIWEHYDLERKILVTEDMKANGSGKIKDMDLEEGVEFTVLELIEYAVKVSDNTAFRILRDQFGYDYFWKVSRELGVTSVLRGFYDLTPNEACIYLTAIYDFAEEYPTEGGILISLMKKANHQVLIPMALDNPSDVAHKYGWDSSSYHDMAIVYGDAPYAVCVMTDFDFSVNNDDINAYIRSLVKALDEIHDAFYVAYDEANDVHEDEEP